MSAPPSAAAVQLSAKGLAPLPRGVLAALLTQTFISAGTHLCAKVLTSQLSATPLVGLRLTLAAVAYVALLAALPERRWPPRSELKWLALYGFIAGPLNQGLFLTGLRFSKATHASLLYALTPLGVYVAAVVLGREAGSWRRLAGIGLALCGVVVLLLGRGLKLEHDALVGDLLILGAVIAWVVWTTESRAFAQKYGGLRTAGWSIAAGGLWLLPALPFVVTQEAVANVTAAGWACLAYLVLMTSVVSYALWNYALARVEASRVATFANLQPVVTAVAAWALLDEALGWEALAAGLLVLAGVRLATFTRA